MIRKEQKFWLVTFRVAISEHRRDNLEQIAKGMQTIQTISRYQV